MQLDPLVHQDSKELQVHQVFKVIQEYKDPQELQVQRVLPDLRELKVTLAL